YSLSVARGNLEFSPESYHGHVTDNVTLNFNSGHQTFRITGRLTYANSERTPIPGIQVSNGSTDTVTANDGTFSFVGLSSGSYNILANKEGARISTLEQITNASESV